MAVFRLVIPNVPVYEVEHFKMRRYISSNKAVRKILGFDIHERFYTVMHLSVHMKKGQRVYFMEENASQRLINPLNTTLTIVFQLCATDKFAKTLLHNEIPKFYS